MFINVETLEYPLFESHIRTRHPDVSFPAVFVPIEPYTAVQEVKQPVANSSQRVVEGIPECIEGVWRQVWVVTDLPSEEAAEKRTIQIDNAWEAIKAKRDYLLLNGGVPVNGDWFHSDLQAQSQFLGWARKADLIKAEGGDMSIQMTIAGTTSGIYVKRMDGSFVPVTAQLAHILIAAIEPQMASIYQAAEVHRSQMMAAADPSIYDFSAGWPATYLS